MLLSDIEKGVLISARALTGTCTLGGSLRRADSNADTFMSSRAADTSMEKVRMSKMHLEYVLTSLTLTAYIESIHGDAEGPDDISVL